MAKGLRFKLGSVAIKSAEEKFYSCKSIWPLDLFPDTITLDDTKLVINHREFFRTNQVITIQLEDLLNIEILNGPFICTVRVYSKYVTGGHADVLKMSRKDGAELRERVNARMEEIKAEANSGGQ